MQVRLQRVSIQLARSIIQRRLRAVPVKGIESWSLGTGLRVQQHQRHRCFCIAVPAEVAVPATKMADEVEALRKQVAALEVALKEKESEAAAYVAPYSASFSRTLISSILEAPDGGLSLVGKKLSIGGWVRTGREAGAGDPKGPWAFLEVNDGTCFQSLQAVVFQDVAEVYNEAGLKHLCPTGTSVLLEGTLTETPEGKKQKVELKVSKVVLVGTSDGRTYPMAKKKQTFEYLREKAHLRPRTNSIGALARIRSELAFATHKFFNDRGFVYVHTPIITTSDAEGAGEMFQVTRLLAEAEKVLELPEVTPEQLQALKDKVQSLGAAVKAAKEAENKSKTGIKAAVAALTAGKEELQKAEERVAGGITRLPGGQFDYAKDFFGKAAFLTVSGQLQGEYYASALSNIYTFGPTFRAENSHTSRHLSEFWMIEPEIAFCDLQDNMKCAEDYVRFCCQWLLDHCQGDLDFITDRIDKEAVQRLKHVAENPFARCTYTQAIKLLEKAVAEGKKFEYPVGWGEDLASEHERYLTEEIFKLPTIVYNYPKAFKAFYMRENDVLEEGAKGPTVAAMDVLVPGVGELIGGSQREERLEVLEARMKEAKMPVELYEGYLDLRRFGTVPHSGFGLGFERLILFSTGFENIREVIPFPRYPGHADF